MRDRETGSIWNHLDGIAIRGPLEDNRLTMVPLPQMTWEAWSTMQPDTSVLNPNTPHHLYYRDVEIGQPSPNESRYGDNRLQSHDLIIGVEVDGLFVAYPLPDIIKAGGFINTMIGNKPVVVIYDSNSKTGIAYNREVDQKILVFEKGSDNPMTLIDQQTISRWDINGIAKAGLLSGVRLEFIPSFVSEWYGWSAYHPETQIYQSPMPDT